MKTGTPTRVADVLGGFVLALFSGVLTVMLGSSIFSPGLTLHDYVIGIPLIALSFMGCWHGIRMVSRGSKGEPREVRGASIWTQLAGVALAIFGGALSYLSLASPHTGGNNQAAVDYSLAVVTLAVAGIGLAMLVRTT